MKPIKTYLHRLGVCLLFATFLFSKTSTAQTAPPVQWKKSFGGTSYDNPYGIVSTPDNGFIVAGYAASHDIDVVGNHGVSAEDVWLIRLDSNGVVKWKKCFGSSNGGEVAYSIVTTRDGNYILAGTTSAAGDDVSKFRHNVHYTFTDIWIVKFSGSGNIIWEKSYGGISSDKVSKIIQVSDGGYVFVGSTISNDDDVSGNHGLPSASPGTIETGDVWLVKIDSIGALKWQKCLGGTGGDGGTDILETSDKGILLLGDTNSDDGDIKSLKGKIDIWLVKMDSVGNIQWSKTYGGTGGDFANSVVKNITGGYVFVGETSSNDIDVANNKGASDLWLVSINDTGKILWQKNYGGTRADVGKKVIQTPDSGFIVAGVTNSNDKDVSVSKGNNDWWLLKLDKSLNIKWDKSFGTLKSDYLNALLLVDDGYVLVGEMWDNSGDHLHSHKGLSDWVVIKLKDNFKPTSVSNTVQNTDIKVYPSPTSGLVHIELPQGYEKAEIRVYDVMGKQIDVNIAKQGQSQVVDLSRFAASAYTIQVLHEGESSSYKVIKQ